MATTKTTTAKKTAATRKSSKSNTTAKKTKPAAEKKTPAVKTKSIKIDGKRTKVEEKRSSRYHAQTGQRVQKQCSRCKKWQPMEKFSRPDRDCRCKDCNSEYAKELRERKAAETDAAEKAGKSKNKNK